MADAALVAAATLVAKAHQLHRQARGCPDEATWRRIDQMLELSRDLVQSTRGASADGPPARRPSPGSARESRPTGRPR